MAQFSTNFTEYPVSSQPHDWTERWTTSSSTWTTNSLGGSPSEHFVRHDGTANARRFLSWDEIPTSDDVELVAQDAADRSPSLHETGSERQVVGALQ